MGGKPSFPVQPLPDDRIFVVTGGNAGIGYEMAKWCAMMGGKVIIACRSEVRARKAIEKMQEEFQSEKGKGTKGLTENQKLAVEFMELDLASFTSVLKFCDEFRKSGRKLHVLCCNAGICYSHGRKTEDGFEMMLQVNYLGHFVIIAKLLSTMRASGQDCRVIFTSSIAHDSGIFDLNTLQYDEKFEKHPELEYYSRSKLYQVMQTYEMARRFKDSNITFNSLHPGLVDTEIFNEAESCFDRCCIGCVRKIGAMRTSLEGATTGIDLATNPKQKGVSGYYWVDCKQTMSSSTSRDAERQKELWDKTLELIQQYLTDAEKTGLEGK